MQNLLAQKQKTQSQLIEAESACEELQHTTAAYRIIGNIMVKKEVDELKKDAQEKADRLTIRIKSIEKQEASIKTKVKALQEEVMKELK